TSPAWPSGTAIGVSGASTFATIGLSTCVALGVRIAIQTRFTTGVRGSGGAVVGRRSIALSARA
ncbi:MAG: hypothetical protein ACKVK6_10730, partial [bacterium]